MIEVRKPTIQEIDSILFDDEIYSRISDDNCPSKEEVRKLFLYDDCDYFGCYVDQKIIGLASVEASNRFHFSILKPYRRFATQMLIICLEKINKPIFCEIPTLYQSVINFAKKVGFKEREKIKRFYFKNSINYERIKLTYE